MNAFESPILRVALGCIVFLLALATLIVAVLRARDKEKDRSELELRIRSWWWITGIFVLAISVNKTVSVVVFGLISFLAFKEYLTLVPTRRTDHMPLLWVYLAIPIQFYWIWIGWYGMFIIFIPVIVFLFLPIPMIIIGDTKGFLRAAATLHWGLMTTVFSLSHLSYLIVLPTDKLSGKQAPGEGPLLVLFVVLLTELNDIAQYIWGKSFGRRKVVPTVSPNKTLAGLVGGVLTTSSLACLIGPYLSPMNYWQSALAGLIIGSTGFFGDVVISAVKRDIGVKDSGAIIPGHGGVLDRLDSLTYTAPLFFHFIRYLYY